MREEPATHDCATVRCVELEEERRARLEFDRSSSPARLPEVDLVERLPITQEPEPIPVRDPDPIPHLAPPSRPEGRILVVPDATLARKRICPRSSPGVTPVPEFAPALASGRRRHVS